MPHSILKKTSSISTVAPSPSTAESRDDRNKRLALYHAELIQQRKDMEALILSSTEALLDLPRSHAADAARPSPSDVAFVKDSLKPFQPSDYDALIEERNINEQCGYVLCPRHNRKQDTKARYRILQGHGKGEDALKFVPTQSLENWCSDECGKRALYINVQLNEEPAWNRTSSQSGEITLLEDGQMCQNPSQYETDLTQSMSKLEVSPGEDQFNERMKSLSIERGDADAPSKVRALGIIEVRENVNIDGTINAPKITEEEDTEMDRGGSIEGYTPSFSNKQSTGKEAEDLGELLSTI